jgi:hypothetical protein
MTPYKLIEHQNDTAIYTVELTGGKFSGIIYEYGKVEVSEMPDGSAAKLSFEYNMHNVVESDSFDRPAFEQTVGEILHHLIEEGLKDNSIIYSGGVDENRKNDSSESGSQ